MPGSSHIQSLLRGMDIVELLAQSGDGLSLREIASSMQLKAPTAHNLVRTLQVRGFVERQTNPVRYRIGGRMASLANLSLRRDFHDRAIREMRRVADAFPQATVTLSERSGSSTVVILRLAPTHPGTLQRPQGMVLNPYATASGLLFQAFAAADDLATLRMAHPFSETGAPLWKDVERLDAFLADARVKGYVNGEFRGEGVFKVGAPVLGAGGEVEGVLGSAVPAATLEAQRKRELVDLLVMGARRISGTETPPDTSQAAAAGEEASC